MIHRYRLRLDLQLFAQEKTERATPRKRQDARKKGQVAKSTDLPGAFILFFTFLTMLMFAGYFKEHMYSLYTVSFREYMTWDISISNVMTIFTQLIVQGMILVAPILAVAVIIAILGNYLQIGFLFTGEPLAFKLSKLNPISGAKRIFSTRALVEFLKSMLKLLVVGIVVYLTVWGEKDNLIGLATVPLENVLGYTATLTMQLGIEIGLVLIVLSIFDYFYQRYDHEKKLRMSKQDIKDEFKKTEGDPLIKGKIRERQRRMAMARMMQDVPKADVIITNPTHYAVALQYDATEMDAPTIVAKGVDYIALKIREIAEDHGIIMMENRPLARALYDQVEIGQGIPNELFQAVAEVLAYVYKVKGKK